MSTGDSHIDSHSQHGLSDQVLANTPQVFLVNLPRRAITQALVLALRVVKVQPGANAGLGFGHCRIGIEVDLLIFETAPQPLDEDVVHASALTVHADRDTMPL